jgi:hypothetical protein
MALKSSIMALLALCVSIFAQATVPVVHSDSVSVPAADAEDESDDDDSVEAPVEENFEVVATPLVKG